MSECVSTSDDSVTGGDYDGITLVKIYTATINGLNYQLTVVYG